MQAIAKEVILTSTLAAPVIVSELSQVSMGLVDSIMVGRLGALELAACGLGNAIYMTLLVIFTGVMLSVSPMVSQLFGRQDFGSIEDTVHQGLWLALLLGIVLNVVAWHGDLLLALLKHDSAVASLAAQYLKALSLGSVPAVMLVVLRAYVESVSRPKPATIVTILGLVLNAALNYVFMYGKLGFPALGLVGVGYATSIVFLFMFVAMVVLTELTPDLRKYWSIRRVGRPVLSRIYSTYKLGWPIGITLGVEFGLFGFSGVVVAYFGVTQLAAHQIAIQTVSVAYMIAVGIAIATSIRVGQHVGSGDSVGAKRAGYVGMALSAAFMSLVALVFWIAPKRLIGIYIDASDPGHLDLISTAVSFLWIAAFFQVADGIQAAGAGALRGLKDTRGPLVIALFSYWIVGATAGLTGAFLLRLQGAGLWWGLVIGLLTASVLLVRRFGVRCMSGNHARLKRAEFSA